MSKDWASPETLESDEWSSVNLRPLFCIFFKRTADPAVRLHASYIHDLPQG